MDEDSQATGQPSTDGPIAFSILVVFVSLSLSLSRSLVAIHISAQIDRWISRQIDKYIYIRFVVLEYVLCGLYK